MPAAPARVFVAPLFGAGGKQADYARAALADFVEVAAYQDLSFGPARRPSDLPGMTGVGHQHDDSRAQPFGDYAIKLNDWQRCRVEVLWVRVVREQVAIRIAFDYAMPREEDVNDVVGLDRAREPCSER